jgi:hypothetical protein
MMTDMTCAQFESRLSDWLESEMDATTRAAMEAHAARCADCGALVAELRQIATDARALPELVPSRNLWDGIAARIEAPTIALESRRGTSSRSELESRAFGRQRASGGRGWWLAAAAAALVVVTAGTTYVVTSRFAGTSGPSRVAAGARAATDSGPAAPSEDPAAELGTGATRLASGATTDSGVAGGPAMPVVARPSPGSGVALVANPAARPAMETVYDEEIAKMQAVLDRRRERLDPATIAILETNLRIIDAAIQESRAALARDPASGFLSEQLAKVLDKKLTVMRTAAMLPART